MTGSGPTRHATPTRILHWLIAVMVFSTLIVGYTMLNSLGNYSTLLLVHKSLGVAILTLMVLRIINRFMQRLPAFPATVGPREKKFVVVSERSMYTLLFAQPLVGWAMVSASGIPVVIFGSVRLPRIAPFDATLFGVLRQTHTILAYCLVVIIAAHVSVILLHSVTLRDGMLSRMTFRLLRAGADGGGESQTDERSGT